jgi:hypothetical protein
MVGLEIVWEKGLAADDVYSMARQRRKAAVLGWGVEKQAGVRDGVEDFRPQFAAFVEALMKLFMQPKVM